MYNKRFKIPNDSNHTNFAIFSYLLPLLFFFLFLSGCYKLFFRLIDEKDVRNQFHIPSEVVLLFLESNPKFPGWFGREGLTISAVFQFNDMQFKDYLVKFENEEVWSPIPFIDYSPRLADSYSKLSLQWLDWPPVNRESFSDKYRSKKAYEDLKGKKGKYYCSVIVARRGQKIEHSDGNYHYEWKNEGLHCSELSADRFATIRTLGVLDFELKRLHAYIWFSG